jgi:hypothetical protein
MSAFYDLASLVVVPSGYKSGKVYAQKPLTTDGQLTFTRASTATRVNASGLVASVASGVPRLDYLNSTCPKLLLEPQRTNSYLYSEQLDNAAWIKGGNSSVTANTIVSPDGTQNADSANNIGPNLVFVYQLSDIAATTSTQSIYAKKGTNKYVSIAMASLTLVNHRYQPVFNLDDGTIQAQNTSGTNVTNTSCSITPVGNGWYRITATGTFASGSDKAFMVLQSSNNTNYQPDTTTGSLDWQNATNGSCYYWGAQIEAGAYVTSYIPTTTAAVTRLADLDTSAGEAGNFNLTPTGTKAVLYWEYKFNPAEVGLLINIGGFRNGTTSQYGMYYWGIDGGKFGFNSWVGDSYGIANGTGLFDGNVHKIAGVFDFSNFANNVLFIDGVKQTISQTRGTTVQRSANKVSLNSPDYSGQGNKGRLQKFLYFNQNLTDAQLAELTAL